MTWSDPKYRGPANRWYWKVALATCARELFHDVDWRNVHVALAETHLRVKWQLLPMGDDPTKRIEEQVQSVSVSQMSDEDFKDYLARLQIFAAERGGIEFPKKPE